MIIGDKIFTTKLELEKFTRTLLNEIGITSSVKDVNLLHFNFLISLGKRHPSYNEKFKNFKDFKICQDALNKRGMALHIVNNDGTFTEISWRICVSGKYKSNKTQFQSALRTCISYQIKEFKETQDLSYCRICRCTPYPLHIDHILQFQKIVDDFIKKHNIIIPTDYTKKDITFETLFIDKDAWIGKLFEIYHCERATLRILCEKCNLSRKK